MISIDDFKKIDIKIGQILSAEKVPDTDKLLKLSVDFGEGAPRQIVSGISLYFPEPGTLVGKKCAFAANLEPRVIRGLESNGMILGAKAGQTFSLLEADPSIEVGASVQ